MDDDIKEILVEIKSDIKDMKRCQISQGVQLARLEENLKDAKDDRIEMKGRTDMLSNRVWLLFGVNTVLSGLAGIFGIGVKQ